MAGSRRLVRRGAALAVVGVLVGAVVAVTWLTLHEETTGERDTQVAHPVQPRAADREPESAVDDAMPVAIAALPSPKVEFAPEELIDNPRCNFTAGLGHAADTAVYVLSEGRGARFAVLDGEGTVFGDELPFDPNHYHLGKRADGSVVVALGNLRLNSREFRPEDTPEPVRVYRDGQLVFEDDKVWQFGVASDGSSFYVVEPLAGEASRLVVRNLDDGQEHHHDLGPEFNPFDSYEIPYVSFYSTTGAEVMFWPPQELNATPRGDFWFYPADGGGVRVVRMVPTGIPLNESVAASTVDPRMVVSETVGGFAQQAPSGGWFHNTNDRVYFASSNVAYHLVDQGDIRTQSGPFKVVRREYWGYGDPGGPQSRDVWSREIPVSHMGAMILSNNGAWLALKSGNRVWALDADSGELTFAFPTTEDVGLRLPEESRYDMVPDRNLNYAQQAWAAAALERLRGVLGPDADVEDVGGLGGVGFRGDRLMLSRSLGRGSRGRRYYDVFDLATARMDSPPEFRVEADRGCSEGDFVRGLQVHDGRLTYLTEGRKASMKGEPAASTATPGG